MTADVVTRPVPVELTDQQKLDAFDDLYAALGYYAEPNNWRGEVINFQETWPCRTLRLDNRSEGRPGGYSLAQWALIRAGLR